jgi:hypothetical protein
MAFLAYKIGWKEKGEREGVIVISAEVPRFWPVWEIVDYGSQLFLF